jgi:excisionase family DNA binding protein
MEQSIILNSLGVLELETLVENSIRKVLSEFPTPGQSKNNTVSDLLCIAEASKYLSLAIPTIYGLVSHSNIPHMKKGKKLYFSRQELEDWIKSGRRKTIEEKKSEVTAILTKPKKAKKR